MEYEVSDTKNPADAIFGKVLGQFPPTKFFLDISLILTEISDISLTAVKFHDISLFSHYLSHTLTNGTSSLMVSLRLRWNESRSQS